MRDILDALRDLQAEYESSLHNIYDLVAMVSDLQQQNKDLLEELRKANERTNNKS